MENAFKAIKSGGDDSSRAKGEDFVKRVTSGNPLEGFDDDDVRESTKILQSLSPDQLQRALGASIQNINSNVTGDQRASLNEMLKQRQAGQGMIDINRSGENVKPGQSGGGAGDMDDILGGLLGGGAGSGGLEDVLGQILGGGGGSGSSGGGGLGGLLGGLLGGGGGGSSSGGGLGGLLGGLLGGGGGSASSSAGSIDDLLGGILGGDGGGAATSTSQGGGGLGDLLSGPLGKAILAGAAGYAMKEILGQ